MRSRDFSTCLLMLLVAALACGSPPAPPSVRAPILRKSTKPTKLEASLLELADSALARGEIETARGRYERALDANPSSLGARLGLARIALRRNDSALARRHALEAVELDDGSSRLPLLLAQIEEAEGDGEAARRHLQAGLGRDPLDYRAHAALERISGDAPTAIAGPDRDAIEVGRRHPYDPAARLAAARLLLARDQSEAAIEMLEAAVWLSDRDPVVGRQALDLLRSVDSTWADRRSVAVHCRADESVRDDPAWRARLRIEWQGLSEALDPVLRTAFIPTSMAAVAGRSAAPDMAALEQAFATTAPRDPTEGLIAFFTERPPPKGRSATRLGQAEFLGRRMIVRLEPDQLGSRTLVHELLHIYGGMHIAPESPSILNPGGQSRVMDPLNQRIVALLRERRFGPGGVEENVLSAVDPEALSAAYADALRHDLTLRRLGIEEALAARAESRFHAAELAREASALDPHLADVAGFSATLYLRQDRFVEALRFYELAEQLYGPGTAGARRARASQEAILRFAPDRSRP